MGFKEYYDADCKRYSGRVPAYINNVLFWFRKAQNTKGVIHKLSVAIFGYYAKKNGLEISITNQIGKGLYIGHPYNITINSSAVIGENCNIHKGVLIGQENRGKRKGSPTIGNCVWIGINSSIVGNVTVGNDVLIAPNSYVNCDIPDHSVVFGNPCIIKHMDDATRDYINNKV